jgi:hypothetical protein
VTTVRAVALAGYGEPSIAAVDQGSSRALVDVGRISGRGIAWPQSASTTEAATGSSRIPVVIVHHPSSPSSALMRRHGGQSLAYKAEGLAAGPRPGSRVSCQSHTTLGRDRQVDRELHAVGCLVTPFDQGEPLLEKLINAAS